MTEAESCRFDAKWVPEPNSGCWLWFGASSSWGYGNVRLRGRYLRAHRVSWERANGPVPVGLVVMHKCDVRCCVNPDHLRLGTKRDNSVDMARKGRQRNGRGSQARLSAEDVREIRRRRAEGEPRADVARRFAVSGGVVTQICRGRAWRHVS